MKYTIDDAHRDLCAFLNETDLKHKPELILDFYRSIVIAKATETVEDVIKGLNLKPNTAIDPLRKVEN